MSAGGATTRVLPAEIIAAQGGGSTPYLHPPDAATVFAMRAMRLRQHAAAGHSMADFLAFAATLCDAQQRALNRHPELPLPPLEQLHRASEHGMPPLPASDGPQREVWQALLRELLAEIGPQLPAAAVAVAERVAAMAAEQLDRQADALLNATVAGLDFAASPFIAAALQVHFTHQAIALHHAGWQAEGASLDGQFTCPCCGSLPVASITRFDGATTGQRYLHCGLCNTGWHLLRGQCSHCGKREKVAYQSLQASGSDDNTAAQAVVQAETCEHCGHYLKLMHGDRDAQVEPVADDLASVTLDLLLADAGLQRHGVNLLLLFGEGEPPPDTPAGGSS
jgi:FdhE protein